MQTLRAGLYCSLKGRESMFLTQLTFVAAGKLSPLRIGKIGTWISLMIFSIKELDLINVNLTIQSSSNSSTVTYYPGIEETSLFWVVDWLLYAKSKKSNLKIQSIVLLRWNIKTTRNSTLAQLF